MPFIVPILGFVLGLALIAVGVFRRPRRRAMMGVGAIVMAGIVAMGARVAYIEAGLDLNPTLSQPQDLAGVWRHGVTAFELSPTGDWRCLTPRSAEPPCGRRVGEGRWSTSDFTVYFASPNGEGIAELRTVTHRGVYRLIHPFDDPDEWNYALDYERTDQ